MMIFLLASKLIGAPGGLLNKTFCPRTNTVKQLLQMVIHARVIYIRGTPACRKSTTAKFLHHYYIFKSHGYLKVHYSTWTQTYLVPWLEYMNGQSGHTCLKADDLASMKDTFIIIDEVRVLFNDRGLWSDLTKRMSERPLEAGQ